MLSQFLLSGCSLVVQKVFPYHDLPLPSGPHMVGTQMQTLTDASRAESFTQAIDDKRKIVVQFWYPTSVSSGDIAPYMDQPERRMDVFAQYMQLPKVLLNHLGKVQTNSFIDAPMLPNTKSLPLIIFSHGLGGMRGQNLIQMEELASHGYFVASIDHAYDSYLTLFDDGSMADYRSKGVSDSRDEGFWQFRGPQIATRAADVLFVLEHVSSLAATRGHPWERVDTDRVGVYGHSFGGGTSVLAASQSQAIKAVAALDGWMAPLSESIVRQGLQQALLYIGQSRWADPLQHRNRDQLVANSGAGSSIEMLENVRHGDFSDSPYFSESGRLIGLASPTPEAEIRQHLNSQLLAFFNEQLGHGAQIPRDPH